MTGDRHHGHTLFEILLALGLSLVLLVAVYAALDMHWKYADAGREEMERQQLTRALIEKLRLDVRSVVYQATPRVPQSTLTEAAANGPLGIVGDAERLTISAGNPSRDRLRHSRSTEPGARTNRGAAADVRLVSWYLVEQASDLPVEAGAVPTRGANEAPAGGLARIESPRRNFLDDDGAAGQTSQRAGGQVLAEEVRAVRFRYFDGAQWHAAWDSVARERLPRAVEVVFQLRPLRSRAVDSRDDRPRDEQRAVISLPLSEPYATGKES